MVASGAGDPRRRHGPKKGPANKAGPRGSSCVRVAVWVESPSPPHASPNRVCGIGSMVCSVAHTDCPVPKKMPAARSAHDADSEPGAAAIASRLSQLKKSRAPYLGGAGPAKSGDHSSPEGMARTDLRRSLWAGN